MSNLEFGFQHGMWDLCRESGVKYEILKRRCVDICCLQVVRWKGQGAKTVENGFKFLWSGYGFMAMDQKAREAWIRLIRVMMVVSCLELPNKEVKRDVVGISCLKDESGAVKVSVTDRKKIWREHMEKLMNVGDGVIALMLVR